MWLGEALGHVLRLPYVEAACGFALEDVEVIHRYEFGGADGVRTTTFPVSPGRAQQLRNHPVILPGFELPFAAHRFATRFVLFGINEPPWTAVFQGFGVVGVVVGEPFWNVLRLTDIEASGGFALEDV